ncbi:hypothetical protein ABIE44_000955 [Marmoricola sp. OAE513]
MSTAPGIDPDEVAGTDDPIPGGDPEDPGPSDTPGAGEELPD